MLRHIGLLFERFRNLHLPLQIEPGSKLEMILIKSYFYNKQNWRQFRTNGCANNSKQVYWDGGQQCSHAAVAMNESVDVTRSNEPDDKGRHGDQDDDKEDPTESLDVVAVVRVVRLACPTAGDRDGRSHPSAISKEARLMIEAQDFGAPVALEGGCLAALRFTTEQAITRTHRVD